MKNLTRGLFIALSAFAFANIAHATPPSQPWPQTLSDLPADATVRFGTLPNGMRYAIKHNATPKGAVSVRFRIDAGSLMERDNEEGIAHMLEHMAFRGSAHVADGDIVRKLQSLGLTFGADTNAFTAASETVYSFDMPKNDTASVDTALMLMREIAGELNITQAALDTERNVVLAEAHLRDVPAGHLLKSSYHFLYGDRAGDALIPIGKEDVIAHATPALIRGFYEAWYRPERATLIIVGDVDPDAVEAKIKAGFTDWKARAPARTAARYQAPAKYPETMKLFAEAGAQPYFALSWMHPYDAAPDTKATERREILRLIALGVLNQRLAVVAHSPSPPFVAAGASHDHTDDVADVTTLAVSYRDGQAPDGAKAAEMAWRDMLANGVRQDEVDQVVAQYMTFFEQQVAAVDTTPSSTVVNSLLRSVDEKSVATSPQSDLALYQDDVKGLTAKDVSLSFVYLFGGPGPLVFASSAAPLPGGEAAIKAALAQADAAKPLAGAGAALAPWPYEHFGKPGAVADKTMVADLGVTQIRFANGVTLTVKPTSYRAGQILTSVRFGQGRLGLPRDHVSAAWALAGIFSQGGLARYGVDDLSKHFAGRSWSAAFGAADDAFIFSGATRAVDLDAQMQVLCAYVTDPAWPPQALDQMRVAALAAYAEAQASPTGVLGQRFSRLAHRGDPRWASPAPDEIRAATLDDTKALIVPAMRSAPIDITMVGDVTIDQAIASVAATFGALPPRPAWVDVKGDERLPDPTPQPVVLTDHGAPNQSIAVIAWPTQGFMQDMKLQRTLRVLTEIFSQRLLDELRTKEGITYTPQASSTSSILSPGFGYALAIAQIPPDKIADFYAVVASIAADLKANPVSDGEFARARDPRIQDIQRQQQTNEYWFSLLRGSAQDPALLDIVRTTLTDLQTVTPADIQAAAQTWLKDDKAFRVVVVPEGFKVPKI
jgi:zinc protease